MDRLPQELLDRVMRERAAGRTWLEIEEMSPRFEEWGKVEQANKDAYLLAFKSFPAGRIPHTTLQRWYDLRVEQVRSELLADQARAREIAQIFAGKGYEGLSDTVRNAIADKVFEVMQSADDKSKGKALKSLQEFGWLLAQQQKLELQARKQKVDERALELKIESVRAKLAQLKNDVEGKGKKKQLSPEELKKRVDEIYGLSAA